MTRLPVPSLLIAAALVVSPAVPLHAQGVEDFEDSVFETPEFEAPEIEQPEVEQPEFEQPEVEEPQFESPEIEEPEAETPEIEESLAEEPDEEAPEAETTELETPEATGTGSGEDDQGDDAAEVNSPDSEDAGSITTGDWIADIAQVRDIDFDEGGFPVEPGEIFALDLTEAARAALLASGFVVTDTTELAALDARLTTLQIPAGQTIIEALALARRTDPEGIFDFGHFYGAPYDGAGERDRSNASPPPARSPRPQAGNLRLGLIDTLVRPRALPSRVSLTTCSFGTAQAALRSGHGTAVAAVLVDQGASELLVANVFAGSQDVSFTSAAEIGRAMAWMLENRVDVVNVSLTGPHNAVLDTLISRATRHGLVVVAAAGNGGPASAPAYPAALPGVVAVTAVDATRRVYRYANRGAYVRLASYGVHVPAPMADGATLYFTGTSFAAPRVATRIARCRHSGGTANQCIAQLERAAIDLGAPGRDEIYGFGLVE